ncbi:hypothetical protein OYT13_10255 [Pandoraea sp. XJJ-1]|uniref:Transmembrane protein n=1 Tax=Pandoraea cepalis TaxID=2508294 RepID=A0A5E4YPC6_9BURK|nr:MULTISPECIES: hypothetical protein [Pandoraea]OJY23977.1 MAG: hypothetical protein BGP02_12100 [Pandoraea sp. 64-18]WAL84761.1 hypothetical protein OYT13_10255 [Pandoraea sp. XJJ-1]VVE49793.1 hypothetical protein PCE31106_04597 [Pandoraea cepalis]
MKAMLRTVLFLDAALNLALGVLLIASFWSSLYAAIEVPAPSPVLYAQALGVAFVGVAWLQWHATVNGQLTATVAKVTGHINWVIGAFVLGWLISGQLAVTGGGKWLMPALGAVLLVVGAILVKLASSVRTKERVQAAQQAAGRGRGGVVSDTRRDAPYDDPDARAGDEARGKRAEPRMEAPRGGSASVNTTPVAPAGTTGIVTPVPSATAPTSNESTSSVPHDARQNPHS